MSCHKDGSVKTPVLTGCSGSVALLIGFYLFVESTDWSGGIPAIALMLGGVGFLGYSAIGFTRLVAESCNGFFKTAVQPDVKDYGTFKMPA